MPRRVAALLLLLPLAAAVASEEASDATAASVKAGLLERHAAQLARLEELMESLARSVHALESALAGSTEPDPPPPVAAVGDRRAPQGVAVTKRRPVWSERFHFAAAVRLGDGAYATAATALPYEDANGLTKYFAVGDSRGRVFVFSAAGDALLELEAGASQRQILANGLTEGVYGNDVESQWSRADISKAAAVKSDSHMICTL